MTKLRNILIVSALSFVGILALSATMDNQKPEIAPQQMPDVFSVDPVIATMGNQVGINPEYLTEAKAQIGNCDNGEALGCYLPGVNEVHIPAATFKTLDSAHVRQVLSHEMLHWIWYNQLSEVNRAINGNNLTSIYNSDTPLGYRLHQRMQPYVKNGILPGMPDFSSELNSIICTEVSDQELGDQNVRYCSQWLPNRNALPSDF